MIRLLLLSLLLCSVAQAGEFFAHGTGWMLYSQTDHVGSGQEYIATRQDRAEGWGVTAVQTRKAFGPIVTEPDYSYILFSLLIADTLTLYVPQGEGNFTIVTRKGKRFPDQGAFTFLHHDYEQLPECATNIDGNLFVNPDRTMLNKKDEPRVILRFSKELVLEEIVGMETDGRVRSIEKR